MGLVVGALQITEDKFVKTMSMDRSLATNIMVYESIPDHLTEDNCEEEGER